MNTTTSLPKILRAMQAMRRDDRGTMTLALVLVTFVLIFAAIAATTAATQIVSNRAEATSRSATWALDSALNRAAESLYNQSGVPTTLPREAPSTWTESADGSYVYRWWTEQGLAAVDIAGEEYTWCAVLNDGSASCWGYSWGGMLGDGTSDDRYQTTPLTVAGVAGATQVSVTWEHACAVTDQQRLWCWGRNANGSFGTGATNGATNMLPTQSLVTGVTDVATGDGFTCVLINNGTVRCAGYGLDGQLGLGDFADRNVFTQVPGLTNVTDLVGGPANTCAITSAGGAYCWGLGGDGANGDGSGVDAASPVPVSGMTSGVTDMAIGFLYACALKGAASEVWCWGSNDSGQLGDGTWGSSRNKLTPVRVTGLNPNPVALSAGYDTACARYADGAMQCWGSYMFGVAGNGLNQQTSQRPPLITATDVTLSNDIRDAASTMYQTCTITSTGQIRCWGQGIYGTLGNGTTNNAVTEAATVSNTPGTNGQLTAIAEVKLAANPGAGIAADTAPFRAGMSYLWNPVTGKWAVSGYFPELE